MMDAKQTDSTKWVTCVSVGNYPDALTYGKTYALIAWDKEKIQIKIRGDNGRTRWYPSECFDMTGKEVPKLLHIRICDPIEDASPSSIEVDLEFSNGQCRWCYFTTPEILLGLGGETTLGTQRLLSYDAPHMIVVSALSQESIEQALRYIESQGVLLDCTKLISEEMKGEATIVWEQLSVEANIP